ncbi:MAG: formate/nitrite transporter family protein [Opitutales bacterium]|nr:formate/nitrite transporter family protein [Opitutales bacterium]
MKNFISGIYAGVMIAFGGVVYLSCDNKYVGCFLFALGLLTVVLRGFDLYTGKIGYFTLSGGDGSNFNPLRRPLYFPTIILGNLVGAIIIGYGFRLTRVSARIVEVSNNLVAAKLNDSYLSIFILSMACGIMMFLAVDNYKKSKSWLFVILPVMVFILSGFEHSVANMFYFSMSDAWSAKSAVYELVMIAGNGVGAIVYRACSLKLSA